MINILGKIELPPSEPRREKKEILRNPEQILSAIDAGMMKSIPALNQRIASFKGAPEKLINESGQVDMDAYVVTHSRETVHFDKENAFQQKRGFYETYKEETQKKYGTTDEQKIIEKIISERRMKDGAVSEETLFLLMNKALGERYVAMRSSDHDDFLNGTDLLLVDTKTGKTICAFDETVEGYQSRLSDKVARAKKNLIKGFGMRVKYGCTFKKNNGQTEIQLQEVTNIPPLFLAIQQKDLRELLQVMDFDIDSPLSSLEKNIISSMKEKMVTQIQELELSSSGKVSYDAVRDFLAHLHDRLMV